MVFNSIKTRSAPELLVQQIIGSLDKGELEFGSRLPSQRELATMFQVGLSSVREAIKILTAMGYLKVFQGKGTFITQDHITNKDQSVALATALEAVSMSDLMKAREIMECNASEIAAETADEEDIAKIKDALTKIENSKDGKDFVESDFYFHTAVAEATHNRAISEIVKLLVDKVHDHMDFMAKSLKNISPENRQRAIVTANQIFSYLTMRAGKEAALCMREHLNIIGYELESGYFRAEVAENNNGLM